MLTRLAAMIGSRALKSDYFWDRVDLGNLAVRLDHARHRQLVRRGHIADSARFYATANVVNMRHELDRIVVGANAQIRGELLTFAYGGRIEIGSNVYVGVGTRIWSGDRIRIGNNVLVAHNCTLVDSNSHELDSGLRAEGYARLLERGHPSDSGDIETAPIEIGNNAWVSFGCAILKGVTIGEGAIVAAGSIVVRDVPPYTLVAGQPAKFVRRTS